MPVPRTTAAPALAARMRQGATSSRPGPEPAEISAGPGASKPLGVVSAAGAPRVTAVKTGLVLLAGDENVASGRGVPVAAARAPIETGVATVAATPARSKSAAADLPTGARR